jgi:hypothetical protein
MSIVAIFVSFFVAGDSIPDADSSKACLKLDPLLQHTEIACEYLGTFPHYEITFSVVAE